jgi:hypothetical protein
MNKFGNLCTSGISYFVFWKFGHLKSIGKILRIKEKGLMGPAHCTV